MIDYRLAAGPFQGTKLVSRGNILHRTKFELLARRYCTVLQLVKLRRRVQHEICIKMLSKNTPNLRINIVRDSLPTNLSDGFENSTAPRRKTADGTTDVRTRPFVFVIKGKSIILFHLLHFTGSGDCGVE